MAKKQVTEETTEAIVEVVVPTEEVVVPTEEVVTPTVVSGLKPEHQVGHQSRSFKTPIQK
jgi:hypothetical protein